jgi:hypothetical protein
MQIKVLHADKPGLVQWARATWEGPTDGVLMAYSCTGRLIDVLDVGAINHWRVVNMSAPVGPALWAEYIAFTGSSGAVIENMGLFEVVGGRIRRLWEHDGFESGFDTCAIGHEVTRYHVGFEPHRMRIVVSGEQTFTNYGGCGKGAVESTTRKKLAVQIYC